MIGKTQFKTVRNTSYDITEAIDKIHAALDAMYLVPKTELPKVEKTISTEADVVLSLANTLANILEVRNERDKPSP